MKQQPSEKELTELLAMAQNFETQMKEQLEIARKISLKYDKVIKERENKQRA